MHENETPENPTPPAPPKPSAHPYAVLRNADYARYLLARFIAALGMQMLVTALDWELYKRTHSGLALGFVGLSLMILIGPLTAASGPLSLVCCAAMASVSVFASSSAIALPS